MRRSMDVARLNALANHPEIRPWALGGDGPLDLAPLVSNPAVVVLEADAGAFLLVPISEAVYDLHTLFLPEGRGKAFFPHLSEMMRYVFTRTPALEIVTKIPDMNRPAAFAATRGGFKERFHRAGISFRSLSIENWALNDETCLEEGERFPLALECSVETHVVGASMLMAHEGNIEKGVAFYNQWACFAGCGVAVMVAPNLLSFRGAVVEVRSGRVGVLGCQLPQHSPLQVSEAR